MLLKLYLEQLSPSNLKKILDEHEISVKSSSPNEILDFLNNNLIDYNNIPKIYNAMTKEEKEVISYFILQIPNETLSYRKLNNFKGKITRSEFEAGIDRLNRKGIIFNITKGIGSNAFIIPLDLFTIWHKFLCDDVIKKQRGVKKANNNSGASRDLLDECLYRFLVLVQIDPIPLGKSNVISKKNIYKVAKNMDISNEGIAYFPINYKNIISQKNLDKLKNILLLIEVAKLLELIEFNNDITITKNTFSWHNLEKIKRKDYLEKAISVSFKSSDLLVQNLFHLMFNLPLETWLSFNDLVKDLSNKLYRPFGEEILVRAEKEILDPLITFGWIEKIEEDGQLFFRRIINEKNETTKIYVQPNYEILVPYNFSHRVKVKIEQFSELVKKDFLNCYILSKESIIKGLESGFSKEEIITLLEKHSAIPIHNNIIQAISDWASSYGQISFQDVRIMRCSSKLVANEIRAYDIFKKWIVEEMNNTVCIVRVSDFDQLIKELNIHGFFPKKEIVTEDLDSTNYEYSGVYRCKDFDIENKLN
ncbi:MAG: helicase-associated domain-containing protein [Vulcanibacillus sp.]